MHLLYHPVYLNPPNVLRRPALGAAILLLSVLLTGCGLNPVTMPAAAAAETVSTESVSTETAAEADSETVGDEIPRPAGWDEETHSNQVEPNYAAVFPQDKVNQLTIRIDPETWDAMQVNMTELYGEPGSGQTRLQPGDGPPNRGALGAPGDFPRGEPGDFPPRNLAPPADSEFSPDSVEMGEWPTNFERPMNGEFPGGMRGGMFATENPSWVTATLEMDDNIWTNVGLRYKGNSTLMTSWRSGSQNLPFRLNFDYFEDDYPEIHNQRFYGFKKLSFSNNVADSSYMREALAYDLISEAGLPASQTAFYEVLLDYGEEMVSLGLYTAVEVVDDTVVDQYFGNDDGNIYKPEGPAASLAAGTFEQIPDNFKKDNNDKNPDWGDIEAFYTLLHSQQRVTDVTAWQAELESIFDVDTFLHWLAIGAVIQHWDTYGTMTHNYYLYNNPETGLLTWISWDLDRTFSSGGMAPGGMAPGGMAPDGMAPGNMAPGGNRGPGGMAPGGGRGPGGGVSLARTETNASWPLIRYLLDVPEYYTRYVGYIQQTSDELFVLEDMIQRVQRMESLIAPYVTSESDEDTFHRAVQSLQTFIETRHAEVDAFLESER